MILYFSATGNSEYAAKRIGKETDDDVTGLFERIRSGDYSEIHSQRPWVIVAPTYAWRIPRILQQWLKRTSLSGNREIYFVMTCGGSIGNAGKYLEKLCAEKKMNYRGCMKITMPENYIALFTTPTAGEAAKSSGRRKPSSTAPHASSEMKILSLSRRSLSAIRSAAES